MDKDQELISELVDEFMDTYKTDGIEGVITAMSSMLYCIMKDMKKLEQRIEDIYKDVLRRVRWNF